MKSLHPDISKVCTLANRFLWDAYTRSGHSQPGISGESRLIFPRYRKGGLRVSEQEARFAFVEALCRGSLRYSYSVEVPTIKRYSFSDKGSRSASTDLQIHGLSEIETCNIEFKAQGKSLSARNKLPIRKDVQKLLRESRWGLWFHLLDSVNNSTINNFLNVMVEQVGKVKDEPKYNVEAPGLTLHICVLRQRFSLQKDVPLDLTETELTNYLHVDLQVSQAELTEVKDLNGWKLEQHSKQ